MWVWFDLICGHETQKRLHKVFRRVIEDWENSGLVQGAVLTYHSDSLYVCLDIPAVEKPHSRSKLLSGEAIKQIPSEIMSKTKKICAANQIAVKYDENNPPTNRLRILDYEFILRSKEGRESARKYYRNAPVEEILRFTSAGTKIAFQILDEMETGQRTLTLNQEFASYILSRLKEALGTNYPYLHEGFHFVCNPLHLNLSIDNYLWALVRGKAVNETP